MSETQLVLEPISAEDCALAEIQGGENDGTVVYVNQGKCCDDCSEECTSKRKCCKKCYGGCCSDQKPTKGIKIDGAKFEPIPNPFAPEFIFCFGCNGCGKSFWVCCYANNYKKVYADNPVYLISYVKEDTSIDGVKGIIRIPIKDITEGLIKPDTIKNSLIIFDDVDAIPPKPEDESYDPKELFGIVETLRNQLLTTGRHYNVSVVVTSHQGTDRARTKIPLNECYSYVIFPKGGNAAHIQRAIINYAGLTKEQLKKIYTLNSRWVMVHKTLPQYVLSEKQIYLL